MEGGGGRGGTVKLPNRNVDRRRQHGRRAPLKQITRQAHHKQKLARLRQARPLKKYRTDGNPTQTNEHGRHYHKYRYEHVERLASPPKKISVCMTGPLTQNNEHGRYAPLNGKLTGGTPPKNRYDHGECKARPRKKQRTAGTHPQTNEHGRHYPKIMYEHVERLAPYPPKKKCTAGTPHKIRATFDFRTTVAPNRIK